MNNLQKQIINKEKEDTRTSNIFTSECMNIK